MGRRWTQIFRIILENRRKADADGASGRLEDAIYRFGI